MTDRPDEASRQLAERLGVAAQICEVVRTEQISTSLYEAVLRGNALTLSGKPGNDVMIRLDESQGEALYRRYSVRRLDVLTDEFSLWVTVNHEGPGSDWARSAQPGDLVEIVGPRGKILLEESADWHLFIGDVSGLAAFYRMANSIEVPGRAIFLVEIDADDDALEPSFDSGLEVTSIFIARAGRPTGDASGLLDALEQFSLPPGRGHAYLFGEFHVTRALRSELLARDLDPEQISHKAFWRSKRRNESRGEPDKSELLDSLEG